MNGFVPVTKDNLLTMLETCLKETESQFIEGTQEIWDSYVSQEKERVSKHRWYLFGKCFKPRFSYDLESVKDYSANRKDYGLCEGCQFKSLKRDKENSKRWIKRLKRIAESSNAGEPIQIDINTFSLINTPHLYRWANASSFFYSRND